MIYYVLIYTLNNYQDIAHVCVRFNSGYIERQQVVVNDFLQSQTGGLGFYN